ncbi:MAG: hypothetical protein M1503_05900 [Thaumarchaeota archaeon]|nr:hypothetical protein [Nitrososphaerota archaeon]MCL5317777.1 hypothetical protein [Nitrososphaerota archaeon]
MAEEEVREIREKVEELRAAIEHQIRRVREMGPTAARTEAVEETAEPRRGVGEKTREVAAEVEGRAREGETERVRGIGTEVPLTEETRKDKKRHIDMMAKEIDSVLDEARDRIDELRKTVKDRVKMHEKTLKA